MEPLTQSQKERMMHDDEQFRLHVMEALGELKADMKSLCGNGQPGRVERLERRVTKHERWFAYMIGAGVVVQFIANKGFDLFVHLLK